MGWVTVWEGRKGTGQMRSAALIALAAVGLFGCARETTDWTPLTLVDVRSAPEFISRGPGDYLSASADYNGDGHLDVVQLMRSELDQKVWFMAIMGDGLGVYQVGGVDPADIGKVGVRTLPPGQYSLVCPPVGTFCDPPPTVTFEKPGVEIFGVGFGGSYVYFAGGSFRNLGQSPAVARGENPPFAPG